MGKKAEYAAYIIASMLLVAAASLPALLTDDSSTVVITPTAAEISSASYSSVVAEQSAAVQKSSSQEKQKSKNETQKSTSVTEQSEQPATTEGEPPAPLHIDINTASAEEFTQLEGIGEVLAKAIVDYRAEYGCFTAIEDIMNVPGIGQARFDAISENIYVTDEYAALRQTEPEEEEAEYEPEEETEEYIPDETEEQPQEETSIEPVQPQLVNINTADIEELLTLPGMMPECAESIVKLREEIGAFSYTYELLYCKGMTKELFREIREFITV